MELTNFLEKNQRLQLQIQVVTLKITSCRTMCNFLNLKIIKIQDLMDKIIFFWYPALQPLGNFSHMATSRNSSKITRKMNLLQGKLNNA
jgi:hypothetical protein